ncbi:hypothetical protein AQ505_07030 [Pedobacter sp. PACM 27299]|uniref:hypothetical protein n=1 Tax=Pedobacter sp. PACM 27299 TaxID=1727164 RepID=UPI000706B55E|nr:hypothetical protein [Pedobacter sp. PACM 27299]ALL05266.1 hypothetical protein AQ505_07030 [Pedobacter sp. PACM 27299]
MKIKFVPTIIILVIFALLIAFTSEDNSAADGRTQFGFPFIFYVFNGGKLSDPTVMPAPSFRPLYLFADFVVLIATIILGNFMDKKWRQTK